MMPNSEDFRAALRQIIQSNRDKGLVTVNSGNLHRKVGGYPGTNHRMPICCDAMYQEMKSGDEIIDRPPKGKGASLTIRYRTR